MKRKIKEIEIGLVEVSTPSEEVIENQDVSDLSDLIDLFNASLNVHIPSDTRNTIISQMKSESEVREVCAYLNLNCPDTTKRIVKRFF